MRFVTLSTLALLPLLVNANTSKISTLSLISNCLEINNSLAKVFSNTPVKNIKEQGITQASFHYQNFDKGFKGICSNAQFFIESDALSSTIENQRYVFVWSADINPGSSKLSLDKMNYSLKQPESIKRWLQEEI